MFSVFSHCLKFASLVFLDIAQDCSLGKCLISSRAETSTKKIKNGRNDLFYSNVVGHPVKLACFDLLLVRFLWHRLKKYLEFIFYLFKTLQNSFSWSIISAIRAAFSWK